MIVEKKIKRTWLMTPEIARLFDKTKLHVVSTKAFFGEYCRIHISDGDGPGNYPKDVREANIKVTPPSGALAVHDVFKYDIPVADAERMMDRLAAICKSRQGVGDGFTLEVFHDALEGLFLIRKKYDTKEEADNDTWPEDWFGVDVSGHRSFVDSNLVGKRWDSRVGLIIDTGPMTAYGGEPFPPMTEFQIITGDGDDFMPPPLIIP